MKLDDELKSIDENQYGKEYKPHILEIYKVYVDMADKISSRRQSANSYFLSINTAVIAFFGYSKLKGNISDLSDYLWLVGIAGMVLCYTWYRLIRSYKDLNSGKFKVVHEIEKLLPIRPYDAEWTAVGRGKNPKLYLQFTKIEMRIPWIFLSLNIFVVIFSIPWHKLLKLFFGTT